MKVSSQVTSSRTMQAVVQDVYGSAEVLRLDRIAVPAIAANEVLVRVHAAGLDRGTWHLMTGRPYLARLAFGLRRPRNPVPGRDVAGIVDAVGSAITRFQVGDEVFGVGRGSFAQYCVVREDRLAHKPATLDFAQAAVVPISCLTALQALRDAARVRAGQHVLVIGASGGVGSYAVQLAKSFGAEVTAVCGPCKLDLVRDLGADHAVDYTRTDFADGPQRYDVVVDIAGNPSLGRLRRALTPNGTAVIVGGEGGDRLTGGLDRQLRARVVSAFVRQRLTGLVASENGADLEYLRELIDAGQVTPALDRSYPLADAGAAMAHLAAGAVRGKVAILCSDGN